MNTVVPLLLTLAALVAIWLLYQQVSARYRTRARELRFAIESLRVHCDSFERFADDPDAPGELVDVLLDFSGAIDNRAEAIRMAASLRRGVLPVLGGHDDKTRQILRDLEELRRTRPDLVALFLTAVGTGFTALFLRWPETAPLYSEAATRLVADPDHGVMYAAHVPHGRDMPLGGGHAVPA